MTTPRELESWVMKHLGPEVVASHAIPASTRGRYTNAEEVVLEPALAQAKAQGELRTIHLTLPPSGPDLCANLVFVYDKKDRLIAIGGHVSGCEDTSED
jgi:hypothetical protein